ncbi:hypothetical protein, partial [Nonomuraea dietziae]|uniref:hypothetical protein n=1 Tax=Nonomuraea dietziae TaxID=65515 RepID=UPI00331D2D88
MPTASYGITCRARNRFIPPEGRPTILGSRAAGQQGSRAAGQQGSRAAGQQGSRAAGQQGS